MSRGQSLASRLYASLFHRGGSIASSRAAEIQSDAHFFSTSRPKHPESVTTWIRQQYPPISIVPSFPSNAPQPRPSRIPPFPGFPHAALPAHALADLEAANVQAGFRLSPPALEALQKAVIRGDIPLSNAHELSMRLKEHFDLPARFPGYDVEAQLIQDASVLAKTGMHVARSMRVFSDLAPGNLPPVGQLMQRIGSCIVTSARGTAAKLRLLESECQTYIGISFPATSLDKSNRSLLSTPDWGITESAFALPVVLGKQNAQQAIVTDISLLGLPPAQIELPMITLRKHLKVEDDAGIVLLQSIVTRVPSLLHLNVDFIRTRLDHIARTMMAQRGGRKGVRRMTPADLALVLRLITSHPELLASRKYQAEEAAALISQLVEISTREGEAERLKKDITQQK